MLSLVALSKIESFLASHGFVLKSNVSKSKRNDLHLNYYVL